MNHKIIVLAIIALSGLTLSATEKVDCEKMLELVKEFAQDVENAYAKHTRYKTEITQDRYYGSLAALYHQIEEAAKACPSLKEEFFLIGHEFCD